MKKQKKPTPEQLTAAGRKTLEQLTVALSPFKPFSESDNPERLIREDIGELKRQGRIGKVIRTRGPAGQPNVSWFPANTDDEILRIRGYRMSLKQLTAERSVFSDLLRSYELLAQVAKPAQPEPDFDAIDYQVRFDNVPRLVDGWLIAQDLKRKMPILQAANAHAEEDGRKHPPEWYIRLAILTELDTDPDATGFKASFRALNEWEARVYETTARELPDRWRRLLAQYTQYLRVVAQAIRENDRGLAYGMVRQVLSSLEPLTQAIAKVAPDAIPKVTVPPTDEAEK